MNRQSRSRSGVRLLSRRTRCAAFQGTLATLALVLALGAGCREDDPAAVNATEPTGSLVAMSQCKGATDFAADRGSDQDCIEWSYDGEGTVTLRHINTAFNCCPEYDVTLAVGQASLTLLEEETAGHCRCLCLVDLDVRVSDLPAGIYQLAVEQEHLESGEPVHAYELDLTRPDSGCFCITRTHAPWGIESSTSRTDSATEPAR